jgi:predicted homoserine dehydrogenase-like protein
MRVSRMIIVDAALKAREAAGKPVRVAMLGAGFMARGVANQIVNAVPGMRLWAIANRHLEGTQCAYREAGFEPTKSVSRPGDPMGLVESCTLRRNLRRDTVLAYEDVELPEDRQCNRVRREQDRHFLG